MRNDPSFKSAVLASTSTPVREDNRSGRYGKSKASLAVHKTDFGNAAH